MSMRATVQRALLRQRLPSLRTLRNLADMDGPFPLHTKHIILAAERFWFRDNVIAFLRLFPPDEVFYSREDFVVRCAQLERYLCSEITSRD